MKGIEKTLCSLQGQMGRGRVPVLEERLSPDLLTRGFNLIEKHDRSVEWVCFHPLLVPHLLDFDCIDWKGGTLWGSNILLSFHVPENEIALLGEREPKGPRYTAVLYLTEETVVAEQECEVRVVT